MKSAQIVSSRNSLTLVLPFPPTVNGLYAGGSRGRFKNARYIRWLEEAHFAMTHQRIHRFDGTVSIHIKYGRPDKRVRDLLNYDKALCDFLVSISVLKDDSAIHKAILEWDDTVNGVQITVEDYEKV